MSVGHERGSKINDSQCSSCFAAGSFRRYIIGSAISDTGTWMQVMTKDGHGYAHDFGIDAGLVQLCAGLPMLALTMIGGSTADKFDKRKIL